MLNKAKQLLLEIESFNHEAFIVGGSVRDLLLLKEPHDIDIATSMPIDLLREKFDTFEIGKSKDFGIVGVHFMGSTFEVAQFRTDSKSSNSRHPDSVVTGVSFKEDTERRDFTINAMGLDKDCKIIDFQSGVSDLEKGVIRFVGNPVTRIHEDALRMLRAVRFASKLGFTIEPESFSAIKDLAQSITLISKERITDELIKMAEHKSFHSSIVLLKDLGLLEFILPEINIMDKFSHSKSHHPEGDVFLHSIACIKYADTSDALMNLACLFHDIGKPITFSKENGKIRYNQHDSLGSKLFKEVAKRLRFSIEMTDAIDFVITHHMKFHVLDQMSNSKVIKLMQDKNWGLLLEVATCDDFCRFDHQCSTSKVNGLQRNSIQHWENITTKLSKCRDIINTTPVVKKELVVIDGSRIMELLNIKAGKTVGLIKNKVTEDYLDGLFELENVEAYTIEIAKLFIE